MADEINNTPEAQGLPEPKNFNDYLRESTVEVNPLSAGKTHYFSAPDIGRYMTYGSNIYGKHGYNPFRDNNKHYNDNTSASVDFQRAWDGMWKLAGVGFTDTFGFGAFGAEDNHKDFERIMSDYSSTRGGATQFWSNAMLSSGYTIGIIGAIAAEELALAGATVLSGGLAAPGTLPTMGAAIGRGTYNLQKGLKTIDKVTDSVNVFKKLRNIENARLLNGIGEFGKHFRPLGGTTDWIRDARSMENLNGLQKVLGGSGALARDSRMIYVTHAESKLEANMVREEILQKRMDDWHKRNPGEMMPDSIHQQIIQSADDAHGKAYAANMGIIYMSNAITFNGLFKGLTRTNRLFNMANGFHISGRGTKDIALTAIPKTVKNWAKQKVSSLTVGGTVPVLIQQSMEGFQEVGQDIISSAAKRYVNFKEDRFGNLLPTGDLTARGNYYNNLYDSLGDSSWETFFTGAVMGVFASPVNIGTKMLSEYTVGEKNYVWSEKGRIAEEKRFKQREEEAKVLTEYFRESGNFLDEQGKNIYMQIDAQEKMLKAAEEGNRKYFEDNRGEIFRLGLELVLKHGLHKEYIDHLKSMHNYSVDELNDATGRTDITEETKTDFLQKVDKYADRIRNYKQKYDEHQLEVNPESYMTMDPKADDYMKRRIRYKAFENLRSERLYAEDKIYEVKERLEGINNLLTKGDYMTASDVSMLLTSKAVSQEIQLVEDKHKSDKEYNLETDPDAVRKLESLKSYRDALVKFEKADENTPEDQMESIYNDMFNGFNDYMNFTNQSLNEIGGNRVLNKKQFENFYDYLGLTEDRKYYEKHAQTLMDPELASNHLSRIESVLTDIETNKGQHILKSLEAAEKRNLSDSLISQLLEHDLVFDMNELDDLMEKGIMPSKIYNVKTHKEATPEEYALAQKFAEMSYENLTGKKIMSSEQYAKGRKKIESDDRNSQSYIDKFGKGKEDKPIKLKTFIKNLLRSNKYLTKPEKEIFLKLQELGVTEGEVVLTRNAETPISVNDEGQIVIDVRHSGSEYQGGTTPFESIAISAVLQAHYNERLKTDETLMSETQELMELAGKAFAARENMPEEMAMSLPLFSDPAVFLSEALNNWGFQNFLADVEDVSTVERRSMWKRFTDVLEKVLERMGFRGSLLDRALNLSQMALTEEKIESISEITDEVPIKAEEEPTVKVEEEVEEKAPVEPQTLDEQRQNINDKIKELEAEKQELINEKSNTPFYRWKKRIELSQEILSIVASIVEQEMALEKVQQKQESTPEVMPNTKTTSEPTVEEDNNGDLSIKGTTPFNALPQELKERLAVSYITKYKREAQPEDATEAVKSLTPEDIVEIQGLMTKATMGEIISDYLKEAKKQKAPITFDVEGIEEVEKAPADILSRELTGSDIKGLFPGIEDLFDSMEVLDQFADELNAFPTKEEKLEYLLDIEDVMLRKKLSQTKSEKDKKKGPEKEKVTSDNEASISEQILDIDSRMEGLNQFIYGTESNSARVRAEKQLKELSAKKAELEKQLEESDTTEEIVTEERDLKLMKSNWDVLTPQSTFDHNGNKFSLKAIDIAILKANNIGIFNLPREEFVQKLYEFTVNSKGQARVISSSNFQLEGETKSEKRASLAKEIKRLKSVNALGSQTINALKKHLASINFPITIKVSKGTLSYAMVSGEQKRSLGVNIFKQMNDFFTPEPGSASRLQLEYLVYKWLQDNTVAPLAMPVREKRNYVRQNSKNRSADGIADVIFEEWQEDIDRLGLIGVDIVNDMLATGERKALQRYFIQEYRNTLSEDELQNKMYEQMQLELEEAMELSDMTDIKAFEESTAFEILTGIFQGDPTELAAPERKLYEEVYGPIKDDFIPPSDLTELEVAANKMDKELSAMHIDQGNKTYINNAIRKINSPESELIEVLAVNEAVKSGFRNFSDAQIKRIQIEASRSITDPTFEGKVVSIKSTDEKFIPSGAYKIIPAMQQGGIKINLLNLETRIAYAISPNQFLEYADNVLEDDSTFKQSDLNTTFEEEDLTELKADYSEIFSNFSNNMNEFADTSSEELTQEIFKELNKCK